jgi:hypothetical protein
MKKRVLPDAPPAPEKSWEEAVAASALHALLGQTPPTLEAYSFAIDRVGQRIVLRAHFSAPPSEADLDEVGDVETVIFSDFPDYFDTETSFEILAPGAEPVPLAGGLAWRRGDPEWRAPEDRG